MKNFSQDSLYSTKIQTRHFQLTSPAYYHYTTWLSDKLLKISKRANSKCNEKKLLTVYANSTVPIPKKF